MAPEVEANVSANVSGEVIAALVICARGKSAGHVARVEPKIFAADSCHDVRANFLLKGLSVNGVEVIEDWTIGLHNPKVRNGTSVNGLPCSPDDFAAETKSSMKLLSLSGDGHREC